MKLDPTKNHYNQSFGWVGHDECDDPGEAELILIKNRYHLDIIGGITDYEASYSYDDWALVKLGSDYYMVATSGCSCPSPSETWRVEIGPATLDQVRQHILSGNYEGYTMPKRQEADFIALLDLAAKEAA